MRNGIYALASLDGAPLDRAGRALLGLGEGAATVADHGCFVQARDHRAAAVHVCANDDRIDALLGDLDEPRDLADMLGLPRDTAPLALACAAHDRFGVDAAPRMLGEWTLVRWDRHSRTLRLLMAERTRDMCFVATDGKHVAIAPDLTLLARLPWVDSTFDPASLLLHLGRAQLRRGIGDRTVLRDVRCVLPATCVTIRADEWRSATAEPVPETALVDISFNEAMAQVDATLHRIMAQQMARYDTVGFMLSGGLDSSLTTLMGTLERRPGQRLVCFTSAAPPGSGLDDESAWARATADQLGLPLIDVVPALSANVYLPTARTFSFLAQPVGSNTHYLFEAFNDAALAHGAQALIDGSGGEMTVSNYGDLLGGDPRVAPLRRWARAMRERWHATGADRHIDPQSYFHVRLAPERLEAVRDTIGAEWAEGELPKHRRRAGQSFGIEYGATKAALEPSATLDPRLRNVQPFFDRRLLRQFAAYPAGMVAHRGVWRAPARALLGDRVPAAVSQRPGGKPFSPTYVTMLRDHAGEALARLPGQRAAGAGDWLDLDWLESALRDAQHAPPTTTNRRFELQLTASAAEFFCWWRGLGL